MFRILYVDDEPDLLELGKIFLERSCQFSVDTITAAPAALVLLDEKRYDAIIADYHMPGMNGIDFLKQVRSSGSSIPFILFTGRGREEVVIQALNEGADFYLQKGGEPVSQFTELAHHVHRAIQQRRAEASVRDLERREADIINFLPDATFAIDAGGVVIAWNRAIEEMTGVPAAEMLGKGNYEYAVPFYGQRQPILIDLVVAPDEAIAGHYSHITRKKDILIADTTLTALREKPVTYMVIASPLYDRQGRIVGAIESIRDITERKQAEDLIHESEERYRKTFENSPIGMTLVTPDFRFYSVNPAWVAMTGYSAEELLKMSFVDITHPDCLAGDLEHIQELIAGTIPVYSTEKRYVRKDGSTLIGLLKVTTIRDQQGSLRFLAAQIEDITERKTAEKKLQDSEARYRNVVEDQTEFISRFLPDGTHVFVNEAYCRYFGLKRDEILGHRFRPKIPAGDKERVRQFFASLTPDHPVEYIRHRIIMPDGNIRWQRWSDRAIFDRDGHVREYQSVGRDITEQEITEESLRISQNNLNEAMDLARLATWEFDHHTGLITLNDRFYTIFGASAEREGGYRMTLERFLGFVHPDDRDRINREITKSRDSRDLLRGFPLEYRIIRQDGEARHIVAHIFGIPDSDSRVMTARGVIQDITGQKQAEESFVRSEERLQLALSGSDTGMWEVDVPAMSGTIDARAAQILGYQLDDIGSYIVDWDALSHPDDVPRISGKLADCLEGRTPYFESEHRMRHASGRWIWVAGKGKITRRSPDGSPLRISGTLQDITKRRQAEEELRLANRKLNLLSDITRHDINNQVMALKGFLAILHKKISDPACEQLFGKITGAGNRISAMIEFAREYADVGISAPVWLDCRTMVDSLAGEAPLGQVQVKNDLPSGMEISADPLIARVFYNLMDNAARYGGKIATIRFSVMERDGDRIIVCEDDGDGVPADRKGLIFERGFGKNTGLGLALSRDVLDITGISIRETGTPGKGARFELTVPKGAYRFTG